MRRGLGALLLVLLVAPASRAPADPASEANTRFLWGRELYGRGRYREALDQFLSSNRLSPNPAPALGIARCYSELGWLDEAFNAYAEYLTHHVQADDAAKAQAELQALAPRVARLRVETSPSGATIWLDRKNLGALGTSPRTLASTPGVHTVLVELDRYVPTATTVTLTRGQEVTVRLPLVERRGALAVTSRPSGATVRLGDARGRELGVTPVTLALPIGPQQLHLSLAEHDPAQPLVVVDEAHAASLEVALSPRPPPSGRVRVESNVAAALVRLDAREVGYTPLVLELPERLYTVALQKPGHEPFEVQVTPRVDHTLAVEVTLEPTQVSTGRGPLPWLALVATGGLGVATTLFGVQALSAADEFDASAAPTREQLERTERLNVATDVLLTATVVSAGATVVAFLLTGEAPQRPSTGRVLAPAEVP